MKLEIKSKQRVYPVIIENKSAFVLCDYIDTNKKTLLITDSNVEKLYAQKIKDQLKSCYTFVFPYGEQSKSIDTYLQIMEELLKHEFTRDDQIIALGGGVVGDLASFVASTYKRGMRFINIPTSTLAMVDSSIGGKTAIDFKGIKNVIGTFYPPEVVIIDPTFAKTLPIREYNNGLIEALKAGLIGDETLFNIFETQQITESNLNEVIYRSLKVKKEIIEKDERESNIRKGLNFGHTFGHAYESLQEFKGLLHGEAVGIGMLTVSKNKDYYNRLKKILSKLGINECEFNSKDVLKFIENDKKVSSNGTIDVIEVDKIGTFSIKTIPIKEISKYME